MAGFPLKGRGYEGIRGGESSGRVWEPLVFHSRPGRGLCQTGLGFQGEGGLGLMLSVKLMLNIGTIFR